jgi:hypothetical protein
VDGLDGGGDVGWESCGARFCSSYLSGEEHGPPPYVGHFSGLREV